MPAFVIADITILDPALFDEYRKAVPATIAAFGGRYLTRGGVTETVEGDWRPSRLTMLQFDSMERARTWYASPEYQRILPLRTGSADTRLLFAEGL
jgi:uncharacterized protein (DUF1330 family)